MKIDERVSSYMALLESQTKSAVLSGPDVENRSASEEGAVTVELSPDPAQLAEDEARRVRLNIIRQQLAEGSYNISGKDVADKILTVLKG